MTAIERLQQQSERQKVEKWLDHIQEFDPATREEVINQCKTDQEARAYFVKRFEDDCK